MLSLVALPCTACFSASNDLFDRAENARAAGDYANALSTYQKIIDRDPSAPSAHRAYLLMGDVYLLGTHNISQAQRVYEDLARRGKGSEEGFQARRRLAEMARNRRDFRQAIVEYQRLLQDYPGRDEAVDFQNAIADCYFTLSDFNQARLEYETVLTRFAKQAKNREILPRAAFQVAESYFMENSCREALSAYERLQKRFPKSAYDVRAQFGIANCEEEIGNHGKALKLYAEVLPRYPNPEVVQLKIKNLKQRMEKSLPPPQEALLKHGPQEH